LRITDVIYLTHEISVMGRLMVYNQHSANGPHVVAQVVQILVHSQNAVTG